MKDHRLIDERSLAFDRLTAAKIAADPALIERARGTLRRWLTAASPRVRPVLLEWEALLKAPLEELLAALTGTDECAVSPAAVEPLCRYPFRRGAHGNPSGIPAP
jgi:hypothetical protein